MRLTEREKEAIVSVITSFEPKTKRSPSSAWREKRGFFFMESEVLEILGENLANLEKSLHWLKRYCSKFF